MPTWPSIIFLHALICVAVKGREKKIAYSRRIALGYLFKEEGLQGRSANFWRRD